MKLAPRSGLVPLADGKTARPWQISAARALGDHARLGTKRMLTSAACGTGKGDLIAAMMVKAAWQGKRVGFCVHRDFLLQDVYDRAMAIEPALYAGKVQGTTSEVDRHAVFMSLQTVRNKERARAIGALSWLFVDEAHFFLCKSGFDMLEALEEANPGLRVSAYTATPYRSAGGGRTSGLGAMFGPDVGGLESPISEYSIADAINDRVLCELRALRLPPLYDRSKGTAPKDEEGVSKALDTDDHNEAVVRKYLEHRAPGIAFCTSVWHAIHLAAMFRKHGVKAEAVWDSSTSKEYKTGAVAGRDKDRERKIRGAQSGEIEVLTNLDLLSTGFDWRACQVMMSVRPTDSPGLFAQEVGRITRLHPRKEYGMVLDFVDNSLVHDLGLEADLTKPGEKGPRIEVGDTVRHRRILYLADGVVMDCDGVSAEVAWKGHDPSTHPVDDLVLLRKARHSEVLVIRPTVIGVNEYPVTLIRGDASVGWYRHESSGSGRTHTAGAFDAGKSVKVHVRSSKMADGDTGWDLWSVVATKSTTGKGWNTDIATIRKGEKTAESAMLAGNEWLRSNGIVLQAIDARWKGELISDSQIAQARRWGIRRDLSGMSRGEASALIDAASACQQVGDHLNPGKAAARVAARKRFSNRRSA